MAGIVVGIVVTEAHEVAEPNQLLVGLSFCMTICGLLIGVVGLVMVWRSNDRSNRTQ